MINLSLDMYQTLALAVVALALGSFIKKKVKVIEKFCIPSPVVGGIVFAFLSCFLHETKMLEFTFDETLKTICMMVFFASVGFNANVKILKTGGINLLMLLACVCSLIVLQNLLSVGLAKLLGVSTLVGLSAGSISLVGGHGTAGAFGPVLEGCGMVGGTTLCTASATFGLVAGSLMGGPIGRMLIMKHDLLETAKEENASPLEEEKSKYRRSAKRYSSAAFQLAIAMGLGTMVSGLLSRTGMTFPPYIGAMIVAAIMRNICEYSSTYEVHMGEISDLGGICLSLFLGTAMITLKLWQLASLAFPLCALLCAQTLLMFLFAYFVVYNVMGRDYDAAVISSGVCGFGMGATPNAMANMQAITNRFVPTVKPYLLVPIVGSMFADFLNSLCITYFVNQFKP